MGVTNLDDLPDRSLVRALKDARHASQERKGSYMQLSGANLAFHVSQNGDSFDWFGVLDGPVATPTYAQARFIITLTASRAEVPLLDVAMQVFTSLDGTNWSLYPFEVGLFQTYTGTGVEIWRTLSPLPAIENGPRQLRYALQLFGKANTRVAFKLQVPGTDSVTISVERTA